MKRFVLSIVVLTTIVIFGAAVFFRTVSHDPEVWHQDPLSRQQDDKKDNEYLVAPPGFESIKPDRVSDVYPGTAKELLFLFDSVASASSTLIAGELGDLHMTYVQRTPLMGYPDYISVKTFDVIGGASIAIYSRSRFGKSDFGTNRQRVEQWLKEIKSAID